MKLGLQAQLNLPIKLGQEKIGLPDPTLLYPTYPTFPCPALKVNLEKTSFYEETNSLNHAANCKYCT